MNPNTDNNQYTSPQKAQTEWQYTSGQLQQQQSIDKALSSQYTPEETDILASWNASEFVSHNKSKMWYVNLFIIVSICAAVLYVINGDWYSIVAVVVVAIVFAVYASIKPRNLQYALTPTGVTVENKTYPYTYFKSFSVVVDAANPYIQLVPQKRFMVPISLYLPNNNIDAITDIIADYVVYDQKRVDIVDRLSSRIKF